MSSETAGPLTSPPVSPPPLTSSHDPPPPAPPPPLAPTHQPIRPLTKPVSFGPKQTLVVPKTVHWIIMVLLVVPQRTVCNMALTLVQQLPLRAPMHSSQCLTLQEFLVPTELARLRPLPHPLWTRRWWRRHIASNEHMCITESQILVHTFA